MRKQHHLFKALPAPSSSLLWLALGAAIPLQAHATDGYFSHGYGVKAQGAGGVGIALPQDTLSIASNPAGLTAIGNRLDIGATWFRPVRDAEIEGSPSPINGKYDGNDTKNFLIPEFGYSKQLNDTTTIGVALYGNGGMNTDYKNGFPLFNNTGSRVGVNFIQAFVTPTIAWKLSPTQSVGIGLNLAYQRFEAKGLQIFANSSFSSSPDHVTNKGADSSYGAGLHLGWQGKINDQVTLGAHYQTRTYMTRFDRYKGLFAEQGDFDIPANFGVGIAVKATPALTLAGDIQRIRYSEVDAVGASIANFFTAQLGTDNGAGFGWKDATVFKLGALYAYSEQLTLRAGYNHVNQPIPSSQTLFNTLAPAVVEDHVSLGATWKFANSSELSFSYTHAFENEIKGNGSIPAAFGGGDVNLKMYQDSLGVAYSWVL
ncbi:outer membrane protein transport protein [Methylovorus menthalis]|uniref:OmpP1/FadL family transporter n=1 Tax=Methylovorus menthalis TaxID=1002227 RepID=UPI001E5DE5EF|nr:outer membrane protein transport protein [Methylovorus menthalis]MCB4811097.1 outer membrane protein transport protein [Methylovorus menthalis]